MRTTSRSRSALVACLLLFSISPLAHSQSGVPSVVLNEVSRITLPHRLDITGAALSANGDMAYWSGPQHEAYLHTGSRARRVCSGRDVVVVAAAFVGSELELIDAHQGQIVRATRSGACRVVRQLDLSDIGAAVYQGLQGWMVMGSDSLHHSGRFEACCATDTYAHLERVGDGVDVAMRHFSPGESMIATQVHWPYSWSTVRPIAGDTIRSAPFHSDTILTHAGDTALASKLLALPTLRLDRGYLQQLADPTSDLRILVLYDDIGARLRVTTFGGAMGFVSSQPVRHTLLALRTSDVRELVLYRWHWNNP